MIESMKILWEIIEYPLYLLVVVAFVALLIYSHKVSRNEDPDEIEDDPSGNSNISKKFIDHM
jgi:hypothetical protein